KLTGPATMADLSRPKGITILRRFRCPVPLCDDVSRPPPRDEDEYEPEWVVAEGREWKGQKRPVYYIKWKGYPLAEGTWEPFSNLGRELLQEFVPVNSVSDQGEPPNSDDRATPFELNPPISAKTHADGGMKVEPDRDIVSSCIKREEDPSDASVHASNLPIYGVPESGSTLNDRADYDEEGGERLPHSHRDTPVKLESTQREADCESSEAPSEYQPSEGESSDDEEYAIQNPTHVPGSGVARADTVEDTISTNVLPGESQSATLRSAATSTKDSNTKNAHPRNPLKFKELKDTPCPGCDKSFTAERIHSAIRLPYRKNRYHCRNCVKRYRKCGDPAPRSTRTNIKAKLLANEDCPGCGKPFQVVGVTRAEKMTTKEGLMAYHCVGCVIRRIEAQPELRTENLSTQEARNKLGSERMELDLLGRD
ncbi:uncharacterized protein PV07_12647, partial [Cladophialophora immunda]